MTHLAPPLRTSTFSYLGTSPSPSITRLTLLTATTMTLGCRNVPFPRSRAATRPLHGSLTAAIFFLLFGSWLVSPLYRRRSRNYYSPRVVTKIRSCMRALRLPSSPTVLYVNQKSPHHSSLHRGVLAQSSERLIELQMVITDASPIVESRLQWLLSADMYTSNKTLIFAYV